MVAFNLMRYVVSGVGRRIDVNVCVLINMLTLLTNMTLKFFVTQGCVVDCLRGGPPVGRRVLGVVVVRVNVGPSRGGVGRVVGTVGGRANGWSKADVPSRAAFLLRCGRNNFFVSGVGPSLGRAMFVL